MTGRGGVLTVVFAAVGSVLLFSWMAEPRRAARRRIIGKAFAGDGDAVAAVLDHLAQNPSPDQLRYLYFGMSDGGGVYPLWALPLVHAHMAVGNRARLDAVALGRELWFLGDVGERVWRICIAERSPEVLMMPRGDDAYILNFASEMARGIFTSQRHHERHEQLAWVMWETVDALAGVDGAVDAFAALRADSEPKASELVALAGVARAIAA